MSVVPNTNTFLWLNNFIYKQNPCGQKHSYNKLIWICVDFDPRVNRFVLSSVIVRMGLLLYVTTAFALALIFISGLASLYQDSASVIHRDWTHVTWNNSQFITFYTFLFYL